MLPTAFPVILGGTTGGRRNPNRWEGLPWPMVKEARKLVYDFGLSSPYTQSFLNNIFTTNIMTPFDSRTLMSIILTPMQELTWRSRWEDGVQRAVIANLNRVEGDPLRLATMEMLLGTGPFADAQRQARLDVAILQQSAELAREALRTLPEDGKVTPPYTTIKQGPSEGFMQFLGRLRNALDQGELPAAAKEAVFQSLAVENANPACKRILQTLPRHATITDMIEACCRVGTPEEQAGFLASAFAAAVKPLVSNCNSGPKCFKCGKVGHLKIQCRVGKQRGETDMTPARSGGTGGFTGT